jgi:DNA-binding response OmpR family regulator
MVGARRLTLTRTEILVMQALVGARDHAITRAEILDAAWGDESFEIGERAVDNVIMRIRRKLGPDDVIVTVRGIGFRLADS